MIRLGKHLALISLRGEYAIRCAVCRKAVPPDHVPGHVIVGGATCD